MYKPPQKKNSSWTPSTVQKKGKSPSKLGHFSIQPKPNPSSESSQEIGEYSRTSMDRLAANVMRSLQTREQEIAEESIQPKFESPWAPTFEPPPPLPQSPASQLKGAFAPVSENPIQRQCAECAKEEEEQKGEERKDLEEIGIQTKLTVGAPGDAYEQEADQVASQVMSMSAPPDSSASVQRQLDTNHPHHPHQIWQRAQSIKPVVQRVVDPRLQMGEMIQRAAQIDGNQAPSVMPKLQETAPAKITSSLASPDIQLDHHSPDPIHQGMIDDYRRWRGLPPGGMDERGNQVGPTDAQIKYGPHTEPPLTQPEIEQRLEVEVIRLANGADSLLQGDYVQTALAGRAQNSELLRTFNDAVQQVGQDVFDIQMGRIERAAPSIIHLLETQFINDPNTSSLDLLPSNQQQRYRNFNWSRHDYPGGKSGPNEYRARQMAANLSDLRPERRANSGTTAVVTRREFNARMQRYVQSELRAIPDFSSAGQQGQSAPQQPTGERLNQQALEAFLEMREAALEDGVVLIVRDSYRPPAVAARNAASSGNPAAVASFSSHSLGLAIDLNMSFTSQTSTGVTQQHNFIETTTTPMQNVVDMRQSPAHKWLFLRGAAYGWYPYQNEPWHWEYNPPGFREQFREGLQQSGSSTSGQAQGSTQ